MYVVFSVLQMRHCQFVALSKQHVQQLFHTFAFAKAAMCCGLACCFCSFFLLFSGLACSKGCFTIAVCWCCCCWWRGESGSWSSSSAGGCELKLHSGSDCKFQGREYERQRQHHDSLHVATGEERKGGEGGGGDGDRCAFFANTRVGREGGQSRAGVYPGRGPVECCEGARKEAEAGPGPAACPALPPGAVEPCGWVGLLTGVKEGAFTFSSDSRAKGLSLELGAACACGALLLSLFIALPA